MLVVDRIHDDFVGLQQVEVRDTHTWTSKPSIGTHTHMDRHALQSVVASELLFHCVGGILMKMLLLQEDNLGAEFGDLGTEGFLNDLQLCTGFGSARCQWSPQ